MGLEELKNKIIKDTEAEARNILALADKKAVLIHNAAAARAEKLRAAILKQAEHKAREKYKNIIIPEKQAAKSALLKQKRALLDRAFGEALEELRQNPMELLTGLIKQIPKFESITVIPPVGGEAAVTQAFSKAALSCPMEPASSKFKAGFIVKTGKIEYDFSFETLVNNLREEIEPEAIKNLFGETN